MPLYKICGKNCDVLTKETYRLGTLSSDGEAEKNYIKLIRNYVDVLAEIILKEEYRQLGKSTIAFEDACRRIEDLLTGKFEAER